MGAPVLVSRPVLVPELLLKPLSASVLAVFCFVFPAYDLGYQSCSPPPNLLAAGPDGCTSKSKPGCTYSFPGLSCEYTLGDPGTSPSGCQGLIEVLLVK